MTFKARPKYERELVMRKIRYNVCIPARKLAKGTKTRKYLENYIYFSGNYT
jgi:hypothetical protein